MARIETVREAIKDAGRTMMTDDDMADRAVQALIAGGEYLIMTRVKNSRRGGVVATQSYMVSGTKGHGDLIKLRIE